MKKLFTFVILGILTSAHAKKQFDFSPENLKKFVSGSQGQRTLDLSHKNITKLPNNLSTLLKQIVDDKNNPVQVIDLSHNKISGNLAAGAFKGLVQPTHILLNNNTIKSVKPGAFTANNSLQLIDLSHNKINKLPVEAFDTIMGLTSLDLSYNKLSDIEGGVFDNLRLLYELNLSHNKIKTLGYAMFASMDATSTGFTGKGLRRASNLNTINLTCNPIKKVEFDVFAGLQELKVVRVSSDAIKALIQKSIDEVNEAFNRTGTSQCVAEVVAGAC